MKKSEISTPVLTIDLDILDSNLERMARYCQKHKLGLRPHTKTHKTPEVARLQLTQGACGLTVAKVGEAEVMASETNAEILVAYPIFGTEKLRRLAAVAKVRPLLIAVDDELTAREISSAATAQGATIGVLVEFDVGLGRCGLATGPACVELATKIIKMPGLKFRGLMLYPGHICGSDVDRKRLTAQVAKKVEIALRAFSESHLQVEIVSGGCTLGAFRSHEIAGLTEVRPGTYVYNDLNTYYQGACKLEDCAARVLATVVSTAVKNRAIIDAGSKTLSSDLLNSDPHRGYGYVIEAPDAKLVRLNEEHGYLDISKSSHRFRVGEIVTVIPNHVCPCVNLQEEVLTVRKNEAVGSWRVAARGKIQ